MYCRKHCNSHPLLRQAIFLKESSAKSSTLESSIVTFLLCKKETNEGRQSQNTTIMWWSLYYADNKFRPLYWAIFRSNLRWRRIYSVFLQPRLHITTSMRSCWFAVQSC